MEPDLIIGSTVGADATVDSYDQLSEIAPTIMLDYGAHTWEDLAVTLGEATGAEDGVQVALDDFEAYVDEAAASLTLPGQTATALAYNGADGGGVFSAESSQAAILIGLGFDYVVGPEDLADQVRSDVSFFTAENLPAALANPEVVFVIAGGDEQADSLVNDPLLANTPAVANGQVYATGPTSFRIDYYSGKQMIDAIVAGLGGE
ncbi:Fe2+-enterobactin ABC transporter substrate-binding protein [Ornithinicoccus hortensis]|uniref:Fe2+-enterobactin ABC transporter substrate-binding protein n=1 Tax=Ornithinicoccus hortensis TaxID=82346 RepID=UPI001FCF91CF|nr:Fe2+-enterobactin ABC transporter substrate-binding protein [Ornithinicoccus hortensis]